MGNISGAGVCMGLYGSKMGLSVSETFIPARPEPDAVDNKWARTRYEPEQVSIRYELACQGS